MHNFRGYFRGVFRGLPPLLRVLSLLGWLFFLAALALLLGEFIKSLPPFPHPQFPGDLPRVTGIVCNLLLLSLACNRTGQIYRTRVRQPDRRPFPLNSWQSRMRVIAVVAALSICSLVLAFVIPQTALAFMIVFAISILGMVVLSVTYLSISIRRQAPH